MLDFREHLVYFYIYFFFILLVSSRIVIGVENRFTISISLGLTLFASEILKVWVLPCYVSSDQVFVSHFYVL